MKHYEMVLTDPLSPTAGITLGVGPLPGRKQPAIYSLRGSEIRILGYLRSEEHADALVSVLARALLSETDKKSLDYLRELATIR